MKTTPANLRPLSDIPNSAGFLLHLVRESGQKQLARVAVEPETGCHFCATPSGRKIALQGGEYESNQSPIIGWAPYSPPVAFPIPGFIAKGSPHLWAREQAEKLFALWGLTEKLPGKNGAVFANFTQDDYPLARITVHAPEPGTTSGKSTDGKTLFACQFYAKDGAGV